jgi:hypothetical protein
MPIRMIAKDLYRLKQKVEQLELEVNTVPASKKDELAEQLRKARAERDRMRRMLDANKEPALYRKPK